MNAILFTVSFCGYRPVTARTRNDNSETRLAKIIELIESCRLSIHDVSRIELDKKSKLPRFNMPFELGIDLGVRALKNKQNSSRKRPSKQAASSMLIMEKKPHQLKKYLSDLSGADVETHHDKTEIIIELVRKFLQAEPNSQKSRRHEDIIGARYISNYYKDYTSQLPKLCDTLKYDIKNMTYIDRNNTISLFIRNLPKAKPVSGIRYKR